MVNWPAALLAIASLTPLAARAESSLRFEWRAPEGCPGRERVLARTEELLGRAPEAAVKAQLDLQALVSEHAPDAWQLDLSSRSDNGEMSSRQVKATSCTELADAAALLLALAIDPALNGARNDAGTAAFQSEPAAANAASAETSPGEPANTAAAAPRPAEPTAAVASSTEAERPSPPWRPRASAAFALWIRRLPGTAPGLLARAGVARARGWAVASFGFFPNQRARVPQQSAGGDLSLLTSGIELGFVTLDAQLVEVSPLLGAELEWVRGSGTGVTDPSDANLLLLSFAAGGHAALRLTPQWALFAEGAFSALAARPRFVLGGVGQVYRPDAWGLRVGVGAEWRP